MDDHIPPHFDKFPPLLVGAEYWLTFNGYHIVKLMESLRSRWGHSPFLEKCTIANLTEFILHYLFHSHTKKTNMAPEEDDLPADFTLDVQRSLMMVSNFLYSYSDLNSLPRLEERWTTFCYHFSNKAISE